MTKEELLKVVRNNNSTIFEFPERGDFGSNKWRGNTSGYVIASLIDKYKAKFLCEGFAGGGTGSDVAACMQIDYQGFDLFPTRDNIRHLDVVNDDVPDEISEADLVFAHPPYYNMIQYAGKMYPDPTGELKQKDMSYMTYDDFVKAMNKWLCRWFASLSGGAYFAVQVGDMRKNGVFRSMLLDMVHLNVVQIIHKKQYNTMSAGRTYNSSNFYFIEHEDIVVMKKELSYILGIEMPKKYEVDIRNSKTATWNQAIHTVMENMDGRNKPIHLKQLYEAFDGYEKAKANQHYKEKIRQVLQMSKLYNSLGNGYWQLASRNVKLNVA